MSTTSSTTERSPSRSARVLNVASLTCRVANSSLFGLRTEVTNLHQAIGLLGVRSLKMLVLGFSLPETLMHGVEAEALGRYWRRTLTKAVAARQLSSKVWTLAGDDAFIAGLLDHLGMLVLIQELGQPYGKFLAEGPTPRENLQIRDVETRQVVQALANGTKLSMNR